MFSKHLVSMYLVLLFLIPGLFTIWDVVQDNGVSLAFLIMLLEVFLSGKGNNTEE